MLIKAVNISDDGYPTENFIPVCLGLEHACLSPGIKGHWDTGVYGRPLKLADVHTIILRSLSFISVVRMVLYSPMTE